MSDAPKSCTNPELKNVGVEIVNFIEVKLRCTKCGGTWMPPLKPRTEFLANDYWHCPQGCNVPRKR